MQNTKNKSLLKEILSLQVLYVDKKIREKDEKKGSAIPAGHYAELNFSILFAGTWE